jgi:hypothetical protein
MPVNQSHEEVAITTCVFMIVNRDMLGGRGFVFAPVPVLPRREIARGSAVECPLKQSSAEAC